MDRQSASEITFGLCLLGKLSPDLVQASWLSAPFNRALPSLKDKPDRVELQAKFGLENIRAAEWAAEEIKSEDAVHWVDVLQQAAVYDDVGRKLERIANKLKSGENGNGDELLTLASQLDRKKTDLMTMRDVEIPENIWVPSFYEPIDANVGGYPNAGLTIIGGPAGLGKTSLVLKLLAAAAHEQKHSLFFSLEMPAGMAKARMLQIIPGMRQKDMEFIHVSDRPMRAEEVYSMSMRASAEYPLYMIAVDYASKMLHGMPGVEAMGEIYIAMGDLARVSGVPVILLAGVSRGYVGGEPMVNHLRWSGEAEHEAGLILMVYNPGLLEVDMGAGATHTLPYYPGQGYLKVGKSRMGTVRGTLGAIRIAWDDKRGAWGPKTIEYHSKLTG